MINRTNKVSKKKSKAGSNKQKSPIEEFKKLFKDKYHNDMLVM